MGLSSSEVWTQVEQYAGGRSRLYFAALSDQSSGKNFGMLLVDLGVLSVM